MGGKRRGGGGGGPPERVRTHLLFSREHTQSTQKRKRRPHNKLQHTNVHKKDEMVQAGAGLLDPTEWTGNQRVLHYGPMAQRDPYFYYYPKGWDILYPATFGFFPYRTTRFRGSHSTVCVGAFGVFLLFGGAFMVFLGYFWVYTSPFWTWDADKRKTPPPIQAKPSKLTTITTIYRDPEPYFEKDPYQPLPPPAYPVLANKYAHSNVVKPHDELKLYPPVIPGCSTLSLHGRSPSHLLVGSPYNTLRVYGTQSQRYQAGNGAETTSERRRVGSIVTNKKTNSEQKRSKSAGPLPRSGSNRSTRSQRPRERENSQI
ncbi:unnamed protein product, partial [Mesorhabditis belari]|uniref:Uncharacterized protein n=1 Tax=Mesorhabditis belari TaxID=2138241 RepID=A0AAF3FRQ3_9BILA